MPQFHLIALNLQVEATLTELDPYFGSLYTLDNGKNLQELTEEGLQN